MGFWISLFVSVAISVVGELLRPKQKSKDPKPSALGDFQFPTADATRVVSVWWGTAKLSGPNTTWFGDLASVAIRKKVKTGWFSSTTMTQGFKYYLGAQMVYGYGTLDELIDFRLDTKSVFGNTPNKTNLGGFDGNVANWLSTLAVGGTATTQTCAISNTEDYYGFTMASPSLLNADEPASGVGGPVKIYKGKKTQMPNAYLMTQFGETQGSGFRPLIYVVFEHCYLGNSDTPPAPILYGRRTPNPLALTAGRENIKGDANPANMCFEVMTDQIFGMKIPASKIDVAQFRVVANVLAAELLGLSMVIDTALKGKDLLAEILRHVDGVIYADPETGLYTMQLARDDYNVTVLDTFDESSIDPDTFEFSRMSWEETANTTVVNYTDRFSDFVSLPVTYQDLANVFVRGGQITSETIDFQGFSRGDQALKAAARANKTRSSPLCRVVFNTDRRGYALRPSSVIKVSMPIFGISELVVRVIEINYGTLDDPAVKVVCTEDIFAVNALAFPDGGPSGFVPPASDPVALAAQTVVEAPHFGAGLDDKAYVFTFAAPGNGTDRGYRVMSYTSGTTYAQTNTVADFTPTALLTAAMTATGPEIDEVGFTVGVGVNLGYIDAGDATARDDGTNLVLVGNEIISWRNMVVNGDGTRTFQGVYRAVLDTAPEAHAIGARVWFFSEGAGLVDPNGYLTDVTVHAKLLASNSTKTFPIASATDLTATTTSRSKRPLPPGKVRINTVRPADLVGTTTGAFALTWAHRNRFNPYILSQSADSDPAGAEVNQFYNLRFYNASSNSLIIGKNNIGAVSASVALAFTGSVRMELESVHGALVSHSLQNHTFDYAAGGTTVSVITADEAVYILDGGAP